MSRTPEVEYEYELVSRAEPSTPRAVLALIVMLLCSSTAFAHQSSIKYVAITSQDTTLAIRFTVAPADLTEPMQLPVDSTPPLADALASKGAPAYVAAWLAIPTCTPGPAASAADADNRFVVVTWTATCAAAADTRTVDLTRFFAVDQRHEAVVTLDGGAPVIARTDKPVITVARSTETSALAWIGHGMHHIYEGRDHISFVLALLLVLVLRRTKDGSDWESPPLKATALSTAKIVTAFTLAHSASLIAASLGWISLPSKLVEAIIAISIAYTALEDIVAPAVRWRFAFVLGFGLIHGLGFAGALSEILPAHDVVVPLLLFNVGVELGQLTIVIVVLPLLWLACRGLGATRYRRTVMPVIAALIFLLGIVWLVERLAETTILGI